MNKLLFVIFSFFYIAKANCQTIDFTFESSNGLYCNPSTILFKQTCTGNPLSFIWNFGNNTYSDKPIDSAIYSIAGSYTVKLIAIFDTTTLEISKTIVINPEVTASIRFDKNYICQPGTINFTGPVNSNIKNYEWNFGDGTAIVNTASNTISHSFANFGTNIVNLKATSNSGCSDTANTIITIRMLEVTATASRSRGCVPADVNFSGDVTLPINSSVTSYTWDFGDGSPPFVSAGDTTTHVYTLMGDFFPNLTVTTSEGCTGIYNFSKFYFGTAPLNSFGYIQADSICGSDSAVFIARGTNANRYYWEFGDGSSASTPDSIIKHKYNTTGNKTVRLKTLHNYCDARSYAFPITIKGVIAKYSWSNTCSNKNTYSFIDTSSGVPTSALWNFGDGTQLANVTNPVHSFPQYGQFRTSLYLQDTVSGCSDSTYRIVYTATPDLYSTDSSICINNTASFSILDNYTYDSTRYTWNVAGSQAGPVAEAAITVNANKVGSFINFVVINIGLESCPDTVQLSRPLLVRGPDLDFTAPADICLNTQLIVTNNSKPFLATDSIRTWYWNFGNLVTNDSIFQPAPYQYTDAGTYTVKLGATDKNGCRDSLTKSVLIKPSPFIHITPTMDSLSNCQSVTMIAFHNNDLVWSPANNISCADCDTTIATPLVSTRYYATATNSFNCSAQDSNYIEVAIPFPVTVVPSEVYICRDEDVTVDVNPKGKRVLWSPTTGLRDSTKYDPVLAPQQNTVYTVTLSDSTGCLVSSSATVNVHVKSLPFVDAGPDKFYLKGTGYFFAPVYSNNVKYYLWEPSDLLSCNDCPIPKGVATRNQKYILTVTSDSGCVATDNVTIGVDCKSANIFMPKAFTPNSDNLNDLFYPITTGIKSILKFTIYNRQGRILYEARNFSPNDKLYGWNGKFKGVSQNMDTYIYTIETICETGEMIFKKGSLILMK